MTLAVQVVAILFMLIMIFLGIWSFVIANKAYRQIKYKNYLLEKIAHNISLIRNKEKIFDNLKDRKLKNISMQVLSMGMTNDYKIAIQEGATMIRVGSGIFGLREK